MTTRTRAAGILLATTMTALVAACSTDGGADAGSSDASSEVSSAGRGSEGMASDGGGSDSAGDAEAPGVASRDVGETSSSGSGSGTGSTFSPESRAIIATGTVSLSSKDVAATRREVQRIVDAQGGDITDENTETDDEGATAYARLVIRVPSSKFGDTMEALEKAGVLRSSDRGSEDVTTQVIDTEARLRAQEASLRRVELLLAEADTLKEIIWIESQLTSRQAELDSLTAQQSWLDDQTSLSTITVDISTAPDEVEEEKTDDTPAGFVAGLRGGMKALGAMLAAVATILGALLPFAAVALVLGLPVWLVVRRRRTPVAARADAADA